MFCYAVKIVNIFITIFFLFPFFFVVSFFDWPEQGTHFYGTPHDELRTPVKGQWNGRVHTGLCWAGKYALLWHVNGTGGTQLEPLGQVFISAFCFIRHATPPPAPQCASCCLPLWLLMLCCAVLCCAVPGQHLVVLQRTQPKPGDKSQPTWTIFSFAPSFCALMIIGLISFSHRSHCSLLDLLECTESWHCLFFLPLLWAWNRLRTSSRMLYAW